MEQRIRYADDMCHLFLAGSITPEVHESNCELNSLKEGIGNIRNELEQSSKTANLWLGYQYIVSIIRNIIQTDRLGNWELHLQALTVALPIFAAGGHFNYTKSLYLYLQEMNVLEDKNLDLYQRFKVGNFVVRRSARPWAGLSADLVIEQELMKALKTTGGLTRGSGMSEVQRAVWLLSMPICSMYKEKMEEIVNKTYVTSKQHKATSFSRTERDKADTQKVILYLQQITPFSRADSALRNIATGVTASDSVSVCEFLSVGTMVLGNMKNAHIFSISFKRNYSVNTRGHSSHVKTSGGGSIVPALLFQRLMLAAQNSDLDMHHILTYEMCAYPPSLFESLHILRKANKPDLKVAICKHVQEFASPTDSAESEQPHEHSQVFCETEPVVHMRYVLDDGSLLYRVKWKKHSSYAEIAAAYVNIVKTGYPNAVIIFDGYSNGPSTNKRRRAKGMDKRSPTIKFSSDRKFGGNKEVFLANKANKERSIHILGDTLSGPGYGIIYCEGDADVDIAKTAIGMSEQSDVTVIGEDTDLLILLLHYYNASLNKIYFRSDRSSKSNNERKVLDIGYLKATLGEDICQCILFIHAFTGCDTTSQFCRIGKGTCFSKLVKSKALQQLARRF